MSTQKELKERLLAYLQGELEEAERQEVVRWINETEEHRAMYLEMRRRYYFMRWYFRENEVCVGAAREKLRKKWRKSPVLSMRYVAVAASLAVLVGSALLFRRGETEMTAKKLPGKPQVVLVSSSGEKINLTQASTCILERDSSLVKVDAAGCIEYVENVKDTVEIFNKILVPRGGEYLVSLSDGTKVWLDALSELEYPVQFVSGRRVVKLKGRAYFKVAKDTNRSFLVSSGDFRLQVYGTEFNVDVYPEDSVRVVLVNGSVGFKANAAAAESRLKPGQMGLANVQTGGVEICDVDVYPYVAWKNREIVFVDKPLENILDELARWYDVEFFYSRPMLKDIRFSLDIERYDSISGVLDKLQKTGLVRFDIKGKSITVSD